jgi:hypothetical protein
MSSFLMKNPLSGGPDSGFDSVSETLCHYQARQFQAAQQEEKQQGTYEHPCCADNDDNVLNSSIHLQATLELAIVA